MGLSETIIGDEDVLVPTVMLEYIPYRLIANWNDTDKKLAGVEMPGLMEIDSNYMTKSSSAILCWIA